MLRATLPARPPAITVSHRVVARCASLLVAALASGGCYQEMSNQPRVKPLSPSSYFGDDRSARPIPAGTVARGQLDDDELLVTGRQGNAWTSVFPFAMGRAELERGRERYEIFCSPCHDRTGNGRGMVVQRGYRLPPSYHIQRLRQAPAGYLFDVITRGFGAMPDYAAQVPARDRWLIAAYIRALQLSQDARVADLTPDERLRLEGPR